MGARNAIHLYFNGIFGNRIVFKRLTDTSSLQENKIEPISFVGGEDYKGPGAVQSGPKPKE